MSGQHEVPDAYPADPAYVEYINGADVSGAEIADPIDDQAIAVTSSRRPVFSPEERAERRTKRPIDIASEAGMPVIHDEGDVKALHQLDEAAAQLWHDSTDPNTATPPINTEEVGAVREIVRRAIRMTGSSVHGRS